MSDESRRSYKYHLKTNIMTKTEKTLAGVVAGSVAGAALGVLFAPDKGENTRKKIADKAEDVIHSLEDKIEELKTKTAKIREMA
jgi:gas vesicle protein